MTEDVAALSFEEALAELDRIIERLEAGDVGLDEAIAWYERGVRLAQRCAELLDRTEQRVTQLVVGATGQLVERPFEVTPNETGESGGDAGRKDQAGPPGRGTTPSGMAPRARPPTAGDRSALFPGIDPLPPASPGGVEGEDIPF